MKKTGTFETRPNIDNLNGFQILEPFDSHDDSACESPGKILELRTSSIYLDINGVETLPEPEDLGFLITQTQQAFDERWKEQEGSLYEQELRAYVFDLWDKHSCICGQWEQNHDDLECEERFTQASARYWEKENG